MSKRLLRHASSAILFLTIWFLWPRELDGYTLGRDGRASVPDYAMANARYVSVKAGKLEVETRAQEASFNMHTGTMDAKSIVAFLYNQAGQRTITTADHGSFLMNERELRLRDNVQTLSPDGFLMKGPVVHYNLNKRLVTAPEPVEGETFEREVLVWGNRAESRLDENKVHLIGNARSHFTEKKHGLTKIRGDSAVVNRDEDKVTFHDNVRVDQDKVVGTSQAADLFYSNSDKNVRYMAMNTDVKIVEEKGRYTRSQVAEFFAPTDTIVLTGFPAVYDGDDAVTGDKITVYRATGVVEVLATNAAASQQQQPSKDGKGSPPPLTKEDEELIP
jgi:LPS export ABC transporter protein LptC